MLNTKKNKKLKTSSGSFYDFTQSEKIAWWKNKIAWRNS
jgi:hypothetical protein